ncbi:MAG: DUF1501 domain-containing protein [Planctomycetes bacterium]|nr:DUF1501 domain-containing protein [Planctomycetota bacterium]
MITMLGSPRLSCDGLTRRETLKVGALSLLGGFFNLPSLLALEQARGSRGRRGKAKSVLLLYLQGGPATQDMFDLKPDAPDGIRSEFKPIATSAPGITVCEHLPRLAKWMHKTVVVRSVYHNGGCHNNLPMYTGYDVPPPDDSPRDTDPPSMGSVLLYHEQKILGHKAGELPNYVYLPCPLGWGEARRKPGPSGGFLGQRYDPLCTECTAYTDRPMTKSDDMQVVRGEPIFKDLDLPEGMTLDRLSSRRSLMQQFDDQLRRTEAPPHKGYAGKQKMAFNLLTSARVREAFDLSREPDRLRERYGRSLFGSSTLLARRLLERGVRFVNVSWDNFRERFQFPPSNQVWDTHERNFPILKENHLPNFDQTYSALMEDLDHRGLLDETLVVTMGEMGRTPKINANAGRDHWTFCYSVLLAGAGVHGGSVCGASDAHAAYIKDRPVHIRDICATIYRCLGIDPEMTVYDHGRRPVPIAHGGQPLKEILV